MAELSTTERLQPALLDRLIDDDPKNPLESRDRRLLSMRQLRAAVLRDLTWLLNTPCRTPDDEIHDFPLVARSVLNYGLPSMAGMTASSARAARLEAGIREAVEAFEPRVVPGTLHVRVGAAEDHAAHRSLIFEISGEVCPLPVPEAMYVRTEVDLETGKCELKERT